MSIVQTTQNLKHENWHSSCTYKYTFKYSIINIIFN